MNSTIGHIYLYVSDLGKSYLFYKPFLEYLGYKEDFKADWGFAFIKEGTSIWFEQTPKNYLKDGYNRRRTGLNHLAFRVSSEEDVNEFSRNFLSPRKIKTMYETPKKFPEYNEGYYAVFFEDPDRIKLEVAYYP